MLGIDSRTLRAVWTIFLFALSLLVIYFIRDTLILFAVSIFFAYTIAPLVSFLERVIPKKRTLAIGVVYVVLIAAVATVGFQLISSIADQATSLAQRLPEMVKGGNLEKIPLPSFLEPMRQKVMVAVTNEAVNLERSVVPFIREAGARILSGLGAILPLILIPILAFFLLKDAKPIISSLIKGFDDRQDRNTFKAILQDTHVLLSSYIKALLLMAAASFVAWVAFLTLTGYPYQLLLAGIAGVCEFIPVVGPAASLIITATVSLVTNSGSLVWIVLFWAGYRVFADYVLSPYLMSSGVELHPLLVLFGVLAGERLGGIPGMFFSVPILAILRVVYNNLQKAHENRAPVAVKPFKTPA